MKIHTLLSTIILLALVLTVGIAKAQTPTGPSDATTAPPATAGAVGKILCYGQGISITGPTETPTTDYALYHWYKIDASGVAKEVTTITGKTYTETTGAAGYYSYKVVTENANGCISPISDVFKVYVLPELSVSVTTPTSSLCAGAGTTSVLTANVTPTNVTPATTAPVYAVHYQWTRDGQAITGANSNTYTVSGETTVATVRFAVTVSYDLNTSCTATGYKDVVITPLPTKPVISAN